MSQGPQLVIQTAFLGDLLLSIPLLKWVRKLYPHSELHVVCRKGFGDFFLEQQICDRVFEIEKNKSDTYNQAINELKKFQYDNLICPHESTRTHFFVQRISAKNKIGFKNWWNGVFFDKRIERPMPLPEALRQISLIADHPSLKSIWLAEIERVQNPHYKISKDFQMALTSNSTRKEKIVIAPGSVWPTKKWTIEGFAEVAKELSAKYDIVLVGTKSEIPEANFILEKVPTCTNLVGKTNLSQLWEAFSEARLAVVNDSGTMHMAAAANCPVVSIFGPTTLNLGYRPWSNTSKVVEVDLSCRPCGKHGHKKCPIGTHDCMKQIKSDLVLTVCKELLNENI